MKKTKRIILTVSVILFLLILILVSLGMFNYGVTLRLEDSTKATLSEISSQQQLIFQAQLEKEQQILENTSEALTLIGYNEDGIVEYLDVVQRHSGIDTLIITDYNGVGVLADRTIVNIANEPYFESAMQGNFVLSEPSKSAVSDDIVLTAAVPVFLEGEIVGVLASEYSTEFLQGFLSDAFGGESYTAVVNRDGIVMLESEELYGIGADLYNIFNTVAIANERSAEEVLSDVYEGLPGSIEYTYDDNTKLADYRPVGFNNWSILTLIPIEVVSDEIDGIFLSMFIVSSVMVFCFAVLLLYILFMERQNLKTVEKLAYYDELTGLYNLTKLKIEAQNFLTQQPNTEFVIVKFDFVNFKAINEMFSFAVGNSVLKKVTLVSRTVTDSTFIHARVGVDEFMFFARASLFTDFKDTRVNFENMFKELLHGMGIDRHQLSFRYGRYIIPVGETDIDEIVNRVNLAHTLTKEDGAALFIDYDESYKQKLMAVTTITNKMEAALANHDFKVFLQPKHNIKSGKIVGAEALVRWIEPDNNMIFPNEFIPLFESNGFIVELDKYMLSQVCKLLKEWQSSGRPLLPISVNFSRLHLNNDNFVNEVVEIADSHSVPHKYIEIELTETMLTERESELEAVLKNLHDKDFAISIDDFGSGYSSLGMLKNFKVDTLKIDRSFFVNSNDSKRSRIVVESVIGLAHSLNMYTVAEGVEHQEQIDLLKEMDCEAAQGYFYTKPMPIDEFQKLEW